MPLVLAPCTGQKGDGTLVLPPPTSWPVQFAQDEDEVWEQERNYASLRCDSNLWCSLHGPDAQGRFYQHCLALIFFKCTQVEHLVNYNTIEML